MIGDCTPAKPASRRCEWIEITDPEGHQSEIFEASRRLYVGEDIPQEESLFEPETLEKWDHIQRYIESTQSRKESGFTEGPEDHWIVGLIDGDVYGVGLFTTYRDEQKAFCAYFGVRRHPENGLYSELVQDARSTIKNLLGGRGIVWFIFEVERYADSSDDPPKNVRRRQRFVRRIQLWKPEWTLSQARGVLWLPYRQPDLRLCGEPVEEDLHLMVWQLSNLPSSGRPEWRTAPTWIETQRVKNIVRFVYERFYYDGFVVTHPGKEKEAERYLHKLAEDVLEQIPADQERLPLGCVASGVRRERVFISYAEDAREQARLVRDICVDVGLNSFLWEEDARDKRGDDLLRTIEDEVKRSDLVLVYLSSGALQSWGVPIEIMLARRYGKPLMFEMLGVVSKAKRKALETNLYTLIGHVPVYSDVVDKRFADIALRLERKLRHFRQTKRAGRS